MRETARSTGFPPAKILPGEKFGVMGFWDVVEEPKHEPVEENNQ